MNPDEQRFWSYVDKTSAAPCWLSTGSATQRGYPNFWLDGKSVYAHRLAYDIQIGPIPEGEVVIRTCDNLLCVAKKHLALDKAVNVRRKGGASSTGQFTTETGRAARRRVGAS